PRHGRAHPVRVLRRAAGRLRRAPAHDPALQPPGGRGRAAVRGRRGHRPRQRADRRDRRADAGARRQPDRLEGRRGAAGRRPPRAAPPAARCDGPGHARGRARRRRGGRGAVRGRRGRERAAAGPLRPTHRPEERAVMTTTSAAVTGRDDLARAARRSAVRSAAGIAVRMIGTIGGWYWVIFSVVSVTIVVLMTRYGDGMENAVLDSQMGGSSRWVVMVLGIIVPAAYLRLHLAAGGTRDSLAAGMLRGGLVAGLLIGLVTAVYLVGERALFDAVGQSWTRQFGPPADGWAGIGLTVLTEACVVATYFLTGAGVAAGFRRFGFVGGTLWT